MRIARIIEYFPPHIGGMERHGLILSREQIKLGNQVDVFIGYGDDNDDKLNVMIDDDANCESKISDSQHSRNIRKLALYRMPFQFLPLYSKARRFWFNFWAMKQVVKRHKKNPYSILHLHGDFTEAYFGGKLSKKIKIPAIITIHAGLNKRLLKFKNAEYFRNMDKIICVSNEIAEDLKSIGIEGKKLEIISSGIYLNEFKNIDENRIIFLRNQYSEPIIISVGVLRVNKGFKYLIESFRIIKEKFNTATLLIIGDGPDRNELKAQAENIKGIYFLGRQNHDKVIEYLKIADIFILPSVSTYNDREGTPTVVMEAMAAGLPVVATNVGGVADLIKNRKNGLVISHGHTEELAAAIIELINNVDISKKMSAQNLEDIKIKNWPDIAELVNEVYESVL